MNQHVLMEQLKTHRTEILEEFTVVNLKFQRIINQTRTFMCDVMKVILGYLRRLCKNKYCINETIKPPLILFSFPSLQEDEEGIYHMIYI